ncbi:MAG: hypothetical protein ISR85_03415 [Kiritimatiellales bacterium]|nr:hypothetical protein [Kiritimatiellota bacterium]MBL7011960.1 hypothetical protein [Kiritimatiellales bacterium]
MKYLDEQLLIIDGIGPFFRNNCRKEINWSKIDFSDLDSSGTIATERRVQIEEDFRTFAGRASEIGYNAITLDDLAHLTPDPLYPEALRQKIEQYRALYRTLFQIAAETGLKMFITTDLLFFNPIIHQRLENNPKKTRAFAAESCRQFFEDFPETAGIIFRIGESDGVDVEGDFQSRIVLNTPGQARQMLKALLPVFETHGKLLIFRTWTVGVSKLGDLIWNKETFHQLFDDLHSPNLIISMKYGESDFFRYLPLNKLFFESDHRKLIELQCRREYEGFGRYPSYVGHDYEAIRKQLVSARNMAGISVWCQSGGWSGFRCLTLLEKEGVWNEINTYVTLRVFRDKLTADQALQAWCKQHLGTPNWQPLRELMELSEHTIKHLLYIDEFATRRIFFRRLRLPPLIAVYWKHILISHLVRKVLRCYISANTGRELVRTGYQALKNIRRMKELAGELGLPQECFDFQHDTFRIIAAARAYYFLPHPQRTLKLLARMKENYEAKWPEPRYAVQIDPKPFPLRRTHLHRIIKILFRQHRGYRMLDRLLAVTLYTLLGPLVRRANRRIFPDFAQEQAMGINSVFK